MEEANRLPVARLASDLLHGRSCVTGARPWRPPPPRISSQALVVIGGAGAKTACCPAATPSATNRALRRAASAGLRA